jgi:hypothetical protein
MFRAQAMTLPHERYRALIQTRNFLRELLNPKATPRVPLEIRRRARWVLKHYLNEYELDKLCKGNENILAKECVKRKQ